jgi:hypothetical protein
MRAVRMLVHLQRPQLAAGARIERVDVGAGVAKYTAAVLARVASRQSALCVRRLSR